MKNKKKTKLNFLFYIYYKYENIVNSQKTTMSKQLIYQIINIFTSVLIAVASVNYFVWNVTKHNDDRISFSKAVIMMYYA